MDLLNTLKAFRARRGIHYRSCNFCGATEFRIHRKMDVAFPERIYGDSELTYPGIGRFLRLQYLACTRCGLVGVNPLTNFADIDKHSFDGERNIVAWADIEYAAYEKDKLQTTARIYEQYEFERYRKANRLLDVSCGPGVSLSWWRDAKGWNVEGIDPDRHSVRLASERYGLTLANGLIHDVSAADGTFDLVVMDNSLEHTFDPLSALMKAYRLLRPGGALFIFVPNAAGLSSLHFHMNLHWGHWFMYTPRVLCEALAQVGYEVTRVIGHQHPVNPAFAAQGIDVSSHHAGLAVFLETPEQVRREIGHRDICSDFFNLMAVKPESAAAAPAREQALRAIAQASMVQRKASHVSVKPA